MKTLKASIWRKMVLVRFAASVLQKRIPGMTNMGIKYVLYQAAINEKIIPVSVIEKKEKLIFNLPVLFFCF